MEGDGGEGLAGEVFVGDGLGGVEGFFLGVEIGVYGVGDDAGRERLAAVRVGGDAAGLGVRGDKSEKEGCCREDGCARHSWDCRVLRV